MAATLRQIRDDMISGTFTAAVRTALAPYGQDGKPYPVWVLLTGGSATLPAVRALAGGEVCTDRFHIGFLPVEEMPAWIEALPGATADLVGRAYPQCAVAIGGSAPELPRQIHDLAAIVTPPPPGQPVLVPER